MRDSCVAFVNCGNDRMGKGRFCIEPMFLCARAILFRQAPPIAVARPKPEALAFVDIFHKMALKTTWIFLLMHISNSSIRSSSTSLSQSLALLNCTTLIIPTFIKILQVH